MNDTDQIGAVQHRYGDSQLVAALASELADVPREHRLSAAELGPLDQLHTRGYAATVDVAGMIELGSQMRVLDVGAGFGGPARYLAETFGCTVTGIDASAELVSAAQYLSTRWTGPAESVTFALGDALALPYADETFDLVWMQHVAMNIRDRAALYREVHRVLRRGGTFLTYDVVRKDGDLVYPTPWAREPAESTVLSAEQTRSALTEAGFGIRSWTIDTPAALEWAARVLKPADSGHAPRGAKVMRAALGENFRDVVANLGKNYIEGRADVLAAVMERE